MPEENTSPFTQQVNQETQQQEPQQAPKTESPFAATEKKPEEQKPKKKKISVFVLLGALFLSLILLVVFMIFVMAVGGTENPVLKTFGIDPLFLKESLLLLTNTSFGAITFILFVLLVIGIFRGLMTKKEEVQKKKTSFLLSLFSFGMMFLTIVVWLGVFNFISTFVVNAQPPAAKILFAPTQKEILLMEAPVEMTLSAAQAKLAWERKGKEVQGYAWDLNNDGDFEFRTQEVEFLQEINLSGKNILSLMVILADGSQDIVEQVIEFPDAVFDYLPKSGSAPLKVTFNAEKFSDSKNPIAEYAWDFDEDGVFEEVTSKGKIEHTFKRIGVYTVALRTKTMTGKIQKHQAEVEVLAGLDSVESLQAVVTASPSLEGEAPLRIRFSGEDSASPEGNITLYRWNFGDGSFVQEGKVVDHTFTEAGEYEVVLTVRNEAGDEAQVIETVKALARKTAPQAIIQTDTDSLEGIAPFTVEFDASSSKDGDDNIVDYNWDWDNDGEVDIRGQKFTHVFREIGDYPVQLTVVDVDGQQSSANVTIQVINGKLDAKIKATPQSGPVPITVDFDASNSVSTKGQIVSYEWDFGDGTLPQLAGAQKSHRYTRVGVYEVMVKVFTDLDEEAIAKTKIYARVAPTQSCFTVSRHSVELGNAVSFDSSCSVGNIVSWKWDFGDSSISKERKPVHIYQAKGIYEVTLEIIDSQNNVSKYTDTIEVR